MSAISASPEHSVENISHPFLRAVSGGPDASAALDELSPAPPPHEHELDAVQHLETSFTVLDADGSQRLCLEAATRGNSFVICGAPGTGKCQTIVNLIADFLAKGKTVLCVGPRPMLERIAGRLRQVGLDDLALSLFDPRPDPRRRAAELARSVADRRLPPEGVTIDVARLEECRDQLGRYAEALHCVREPLGRSVWSVLCELAPLYDVQHAPLGLALQRKDAEHATHVLVIEDVNPAWLEEARHAVQRAQQLWRLRDESDCVWRGFKAERYTQQLRDEALALIDRIRGRVDRVVELSRKFGDQVGVAGPLPLLLQLGELLDAKPTALPANWLQEDDLDRLTQDLDECARQYQQLGQARAPLTERYGPGLWKVPVGTAAAVDRAWHSAAPLLAPGDDRGAALLTHQHSLRGWAADTQKRIPAWLADARTVEKWLAVPLPPGTGAEAGTRGGGDSKVDPSVASLRHLLRLANLCQSGNPPERPWVHDPEALNQARQTIADNRPAFTDYRQRRGKLLEIYQETFFELELERIAAGFAGPYQSWLRFFNGQYRRDRRAITRRSRAEQMPPTAPQDVAEAVALLAAKARLEEQGPQRQPILGHYEKGLDTDLEAAERGTRVAAEAVEVVHKLGSPSLPARLLDILCAGTHAPEKVRAAAKRLHDSLSAWLHATQELKVQLPMNSLPGTARPLEESALSALSRFARDLQVSLNQFGSLTDPVLTHAPARPADTVALIDDLQRAEEARTFEESRETETARWSKRLGPPFQGLSTDWDALRKAITWMRRLRDLTRTAASAGTEAAIPQGLRRLLASGTPPSPRDLRHALEQYRQALHTLENRFEPPGPLLDGKGLGEQPPDLVKQHLLVLRERSAELAEWIDWRNLPDRFGHLGLGAFWEHLLAQPPAAEHLLPIFLKSFWQTWYSAAAQQDAVLTDFDRDAHERTVAEFQTLDRQWLQANAQRVREAAEARRPPAAADVVAENPELLPRVKPCVLAAPAALVGQAARLPGQASRLPYEPMFDLVILDDAGHMTLEEALPAIERGRQIIVVGEIDASAPAGDRDADEVLVTTVAPSLLQLCLKAGLARHTLRSRERSGPEAVAPAEDADLHALARDVARGLEERGQRVVAVADDSVLPIELAVAGAATGGGFVLGIAFDGPAYEAASTVRDRERLDLEALQARGWAVHRVWAPAWIAHRQHELDRLCGVLEALVQ